MTLTLHAQRWCARPLRCVLGLHRWRPHPSSRVGTQVWRYCDACGTEQRVR